MTIIPNPTAQDRISNMYVAGMTEHHQLSEVMEGLIDFGTPVANATAIIAASAYTLGQTKSNLKGVVTEPFGRTLNILSTAIGAATIVGRDYLNQPMSQVVAMVVGTVATLKAFKYIDSITSAVAATITVQTGPRLGLPFVVSNIVAEHDNGLLVAAPTVTAADVAAPTTATGDLRGTVTPTAAMNGAIRVEGTFRFNNNAVGGLYGQRQV